MKLLAYIWHSACENSHFESTFLELSTRATAIYKRDASSQTLKSAIYSRDTRESALFSTQSSNREVVHPATPFTRIRLWSSLRLRTVFPSAHPLQHRFSELVQTENKRCADTKPHLQSPNPNLAAQQSERSPSRYINFPYISIQRCFLYSLSKGVGESHHRSLPTDLSIVMTINGI